MDFYYSDELGASALVNFFTKSTGNDFFYELKNFIK
jgi:hypothetical protein